MSIPIEHIVFQYKNIYYSFPQSLKTFIGSLYGNIPLSIRFGKTYEIHKQLLEKFESSDSQYQIDFIYNKALETLLFAEENIPYYKKVFQEYGISAKEFKAPDDLKKFPVLNKKIIKNNLDNMYTNKVEKAVEYFTGGSLSNPAKFYLPSSIRSKEKAYVNYILSHFDGYQYRDKTLFLKGREISIPEKEIYWEYEPIENHFLLSNNYLNSNKFPLMYEKAKQFNPKYIYGFPSAVHSFIKQCKLYGYEALKIKGLILSSETVYPDELKNMSDFFGVDILTHYGHTEGIVNAFRINREKYHFLNSYGIPRNVNNEIIATSFDNFVMPFINYQTGDRISGDMTYYEQSDIVHDVENIEGRTQDFLVSKDYRLISITTMRADSPLPEKTIDNIQYQQKEAGKVTVLVEGRNIKIEKIKHYMYQAVRDGIDFDIKVVDKIEKSSRGKRIICRQALDIESIRAESAESIKMVS